MKFCPLIYTILLCGLFTNQTAAQSDVPIAFDFTYTYQQADGNRVVSGVGGFPLMQVFDLELAGVPAWVVGGQGLNGAFSLSVILADGNFQQINQLGRDYLEVVAPLLEEGFGTASPPIIGKPQTAAQMGSVRLENVAGLSHLLPLDSQNVVYLQADGHVVLSSGGRKAQSLALDALPDARLVVNTAGQIAVYTGATSERYAHSVLGDNLEASSLTVLELADNALRVVTEIDLDGEEVFEGIMPFWADVDEDGADDLVTTVSSNQVGAQIRVYSADGSLLANGSPIGEGKRWRHQLAWGAFGPNGEHELVAVRTPHIGGLVEFYRLAGDYLEIVAEASGYNSHRIGTRNLDMAIGGDFNGDGQLEMVVPIQDMTRLAALQHTVDGVVEVWSLPLGGRLTTNLTAVELVDGSLMLAAGTDARMLRVWWPVGA